MLQGMGVDGLFVCLVLLHFVCCLSGVLLGFFRREECSPVRSTDRKELFLRVKRDSLGIPKESGL